MNAIDVYALLLKRIKDGGINAEDAKNYIRTLLDENPDIARGATAEQLKMIEDLGVDVSDLKQDLNHISNFVTPEMFGAVGDGITDDTNAFKRCMEQNKPVYLSNKHYRITDDIIIEKNNFVMYGDIGAYSATSARLAFENNHSLCFGEHVLCTHLKGFAIFSDGIGLKLVGSQRMGNLVFDDLFVKANKCLYLDTETGYIYFNRCQFQFNEKTNYSGAPVWIDYTGSGVNKANYIYFDKCAFEGHDIPNNTTTATNYLIHLGNCSNISFNNCDMCNCYNAIEFGTHGTNTFITLTGNYIWNCRVIANLAACSYFIMTGNAHQTTSGTQPLIFPQSKRGHSIVGNRFSNWSGGVTYENLYTVFVGNTIGNNPSSEIISRLHIGETLY